MVKDSYNQSIDVFLQIFFISDLMFAYLRRDFDLYHPLPTEAKKDDNSKDSSTSSKDGSGQRKTNQTSTADNVILQWHSLFVLYSKKELTGPLVWIYVYKYMKVYMYINKIPGDTKLLQKSLYIYYIDFYC